MTGASNALLKNSSKHFKQTQPWALLKPGSGTMFRLAVFGEGRLGFWGRIRLRQLNAVSARN